jgi:tetratricopeptide (TPR) repeat protein
MRTARRLGPVWLGLAIVLAACQAPPRTSSAPAPDGPEARAVRALGEGRYEEAASLYRQALEESPGKVAVHYGLGVTCSYLDRRDEAIREFRWVLRYGPATAPEVKAARQWLVRAGAMPVVLTAAATPERAEPEREPGNASLEGHAVFAQAGQSPKAMQRLQLFLVGQPDSPTARERYNLRTDGEGRFRFPDVVPGPYKLTNRVAGRPIWRLRVELKPSETKVLELTPDNSVDSRDDFPES